ESSGSRWRERNSCSIAALPPTVAGEPTGDEGQGAMKLLVTGGGGFLGKAIATRLAERGHEVVSFSRSRHASLDGLPVTQVQGDLSSFEAIGDACRGVEAVFHVAAKAGAWGSYAEYFDA